jgi:hypothetical protein
MKKIYIHIYNNEWIVWSLAPCFFSMDCSRINRNILTTESLKTILKGRLFCSVVDFHSLGSQFYTEPWQLFSK